MHWQSNDGTIRKIRIVQKEGAERLDAFLQFNEYKVLDNAGQDSAEVAKRLAEEQFDVFRIKQDLEYVSDFDQ